MPVRVGRDTVLSREVLFGCNGGVSDSGLSFDRREVQQEPNNCSAPELVCHCLY